MTAMSRRVNVLGCPVDALTMSETVRYIDDLLQNYDGRPKRHVALNAAKSVAMHKNEHLHRIVATCDVISADGQSIVWAGKALGQPIPERVAGIDLMEELIKLAAERGYSVFFFGAREEVVRDVVNRYQKMYPALKIAGYRNGYYSAEEEKKVVEQIASARPDILFIAMGTPKKEIFVAEHLDELNCRFCMGVGGSFDVVTGHVARAPLTWQRLGLEWLYRLLQEPRRMWKRYLVGNTAFVWLVAKAWVRSRLFRIPSNTTT